MGGKRAFRWAECSATVLLNPKTFNDTTSPSPPLLAPSPQKERKRNQDAGYNKRHCSTCDCFVREDAINFIAWLATTADRWVGMGDKFPGAYRSSLDSARIPGGAEGPIDLRIRWAGDRHKTWFHWPAATTRRCRMTSAFLVRGYLSVLKSNGDSSTCTWYRGYPRPSGVSWEFFQEEWGNTKAAEWSENLPLKRRVVRVMLLALVALWF